jgi:hypothetical protein
MFREELSFLQVVSLVTSRMGCTIDKIDIDGKNISITCPRGRQQEMEVAVAIGKIMGEKANAQTMWALAGN